MIRIEGNVPAVVTPFSQSGELLLESFVALVRWHLDNGADALCLAGDNGEAWNLSLEERRQIAEAAVREAAGRVPVVMGASAPSAKASIALAEIAADAGVDALMIGPQSYVGKASVEEVVARYKTIHAAVPLPILVYNSPRRTGINLDAAKLGAICDAVPVAGLKESARDFFHVSEVLERFAQRIPVLIGPCPMILWGIALGARGFVSSGPELYGKTAGRLIEIGRGGPTDEFRRLHFGLTKIYATLMGTGTWPAALKAALNLLGLPAGLPREPVFPLSPEDHRALASVMESLDLIGNDRAKAASQ